jgi:hypothetical protein
VELIHIESKPFQVVLWTTDDRNSAEPALRLAFDHREDAQAAFEEQRAGSYRSGILIAWDKLSGTWDLLDQYP